MLPHSLLQVIHDHTEAVRAGRVAYEGTICPRCAGIPDGFKIHDRRRRTYRVVVERLVHCVSALVVRWKCELCRQTFSPCPDFALPYKRYARDVVLGFGQRYLGDEAMSYRGAVRVEELPVFYDSGPDGGIDERALAASTLHRWLGWLGRRAWTSSPAPPGFPPASSPISCGGGGGFRTSSWPTAPRSSTTGGRRAGR